MLGLCPARKYFPYLPLKSKEAWKILKFHESSSFHKGHLHQKPIGPIGPIGPVETLKILLSPVFGFFGPVALSRRMVKSGWFSVTP